jgi:Domain of unknown function (DUF932)
MLNHSLAQFSSQTPQLDHEVIRNRAPSVFAESPANHVSDNYKFVRTLDILETMEADGWGCIGAMQTKVRKPDSLEVTKHQLIMRNPKFNPELVSVGGVIPVIRIVNSHNWSSRLMMFLGIYRFICSNGMVVGQEMNSIAIRHDHVMEDLSVVLARFNSNAMRTLDTAERWAGISLNENQQRQFAMGAATIRFGENANENHAIALQGARREADKGDSLWHTFNRIQENAVQGGMGVLGGRRARRIRNIDRDVQVNRNLWNLAASFDPAITVG